MLKAELKLHRASVMIVGSEKSGKSTIYKGLCDLWDNIPSGSLPPPLSSSSLMIVLDPSFPSPLRSFP